MVVYQNNLITLNHIPDSDILIITWANLEPYASLEVQESMQKVIKAINNFNCRNILIDGSKAKTSMDDAAFIGFQTNFIADLGHMNIQKLARIITSDPKREEQVNSLRSKLSFPFQFQDFKTREQAVHWLNNGN